VSTPLSSRDVKIEKYEREIARLEARLRMTEAERDVLRGRLDRVVEIVAPGDPDDDLDWEDE
jgi:hypothetical protein